MAKNVLLQMKLDNAIQDLMVRTDAANVIVDAATNETLAARLTSILDSINAVITAEQVDSKINEAITALIDGAPTTYDTLNEIAEYIKANDGVIDGLSKLADKKVDKVEGKELSSNDFTDALKTKLEGISEAAKKVEASTNNGNIKIDGTETIVYTHPTTAGNKHIPAGGAAGQHLVYGDAAGTAKWQDKEEYILSGAAAPADLNESQLFVKLL